MNNKETKGLTLLHVFFFFAYIISQKQSANQQKTIMEQCFSCQKSPSAQNTCKLNPSKQNSAQKERHTLFAWKQVNYYCGLALIISAYPIKYSRAATSSLFPQCITTSLKCMLTCSKCFISGNNESILWHEQQDWVTQLWEEGHYCCKETSSGIAKSLYRTKKLYN